MRIRDDLLRVQDDMGTSGTLIYNIDYSDPITEIELLFEATNGATSNLANPIEWCVQSIDVVDGSDVLFSLPGDCALALWAITHGRMPYGNRAEYMSQGVTVSIPIAFGRFLYDPLFAFNPLAHKNPQLRITFDEAAVRAAGATGYVSDSFTVTIQCKLMEEAEAPRGFLMARDVYDFTTVASGDERIDMPTDYPWRLLGVRAYESTVDLRSGITNYELNCDGGRYIVFDKNVRSVVSKVCEVFQPLTIDILGQCSHATYTQTYMGVGKQGSVCAGQTGVIAGASTFGTSAVRPYLTLHDGTPANGVALRILADGWALHNTLLIPFGRLDVVEEWFNAAAFNNVRLYLTQGNAGAEANVFVQQLRPY